MNSRIDLGNHLNSGFLLTLGTSLTGYIVAAAAALGPISQIVVVLLGVSGSLLGQWLKHKYDLQRDERRELKRNDELHYENLRLSRRLAQLRRKYQIPDTDE